jgi:hypothetical protein
MNQRNYFYLDRETSSGRRYDSEGRYAGNEPMISLALRVWRLETINRFKQLTISVCNWQFAVTNELMTIQV